MTSPLPPRATSTAALADWISNCDPIRQGTAQQRAKAAFVDTVACLLAGAKDPAPQKVAAAFAAGPRGRATTAVDKTLKTTAEQAALINGTAAHCLDFDDNFLPAVTHASAVLIPALLALGEEEGGTGSELLDAYVIGLESQAWLGRLSIPEHYEAGWHATSTIGAIGSAAACARLLKLSPQKSCAALSIASSMAAGSKVQFGTMAKPLHAGLAARAGITAVRLAQSGMEANDEPLLGPWGFVALHQGRSSQQSDRPARLAILSDGLTQKRFPCCASAHRTLDGFFELQAQEGFVARDINSIQAILPNSNYQNLRFHRPKNEMEARFSLHHCLALAAVRGRVDLSGFTPADLEDPALRAFLPKVEMLSDDSPAGHALGIWDTPAVTRIRLSDGRNLGTSIAQPIGSLAHPLSARQLSHKFRDCSQAQLTESQSIELEARLWALEEQSIQQVTALLTEDRKEVALT